MAHPDFPEGGNVPLDMDYEEEEDYMAFRENEEIPQAFQANDDIAQDPDTLHGTEEEKEMANLDLVWESNAREVSRCNQV